MTIHDNQDLQVIQLIQVIHEGLAHLWPDFLVIWCAFHLRIWLYVFWNEFYTGKNSFTFNYKNHQSSDATKTDEFSEMFLTAFDPPSSFSENHVEKNMFKGPISAT